MFKEHHKAYLKVKIKSLAEESRIIRLEEKRARNNLQREGLYLHRVQVVRNESRAAQVAYAFLRGKKLCEVEPNATLGYNTHCVYNRARKIVKKYGHHKRAKHFDAWLRESLSVEQ